ncbi:MAG: hypothetical protein NTU60_11590 [Candidatus Aminicenantes bacterium]|nr:hypothetical protein [Candidatus Aminicenantes bacterium]
MTQTSLPEQNAQPSPAPIANQAESVLGLSAGDLAGLSVDEITGNKAVITMVMHYHKQLVDQNTSLKNDLNTLRTYVDGYRAKKLNASVGAGLQLLAAILIGFGVSLLTAKLGRPGWVTLVAGVATEIFGLYYSLRDGR